MAQAQAWLLDLGEGLQAAVGRNDIVHFLEQPHFLPVPGSPSHCSQVVIWQRRILPVMALATWLRGQALQSSQSLVAVVAYQEQPGPISVSSLSYGGLLLAAMPTEQQVDDVQACELPDTPKGWKTTAISCFRHKSGAVVPILDLPQLFSKALLN